ncbi:hypothetical protein EJB05_45100, partial [Eragrostis curvula]
MAGPDDVESLSITNNGGGGNTSPDVTNNGQKSNDDAAKKDDPAWQLRKYLLLLAILVATVTYVAGMDPPGGVWLETKDGHRTGNPILPATRRLRYTLFYYSNATAFAASLVVIILLLFMKPGDARVPVVRYLMAFDVLCLMVATGAGSCRGRPTTIYASALCAGVISLILVLTLLTWTGILKPSGKGGDDKAKEKDTDKLKSKDRRKVVMLLAIFVTTISYTAALNPPGGFWEESPEEGANHRAGDPILLERHTKRFLAFLICNTTAFAASLVIITLLLSTRLWKNAESQYGGIAVALIGLMGAYVAGSGRETDTTIYVLSLVGVVLVYIAVLACLELWLSDCFRSRKGSASNKQAAPSPGGSHGNSVSDKSSPPKSPDGSHGNSVSDKSSPLKSPEGSSLGGGHVATTGQTTEDQDGSNKDAGENKAGQDTDEKKDSEDAVDKARSLILLLATLAVTVTYQAGLNTPGGVWRDTGDGHVGGNLILLATHARRYKVFFYCNSAAFVTSIVVVMMVQSTGLVSSRALQAAVILDLFGLMGAYAAGSCRDVRTSIYVFALAAVVFVAVLIHVAVHALTGNGESSTCCYSNFFKKAATSSSSSTSPELDSGEEMDTEEKKKERGEKEIKEKEEKEKKEREKEKKRKLLLLLAILAASITYQAGLTPPGKFWLEHGDAVHHVGDPVHADNYPRRYKAFFYCNATSFMVSVAVIIVLVGRKLSDTDRIYWGMLYGSMGAGLIGLMGAYAAGTTRRVKTSVYVFALVGVVLLFAGLHIGEIHKKIKGCVTYQAGLDPPGGVWPSDRDGHEAGDPVLHDGSRRRYHAFFYSNSTCFVTSIVVILLLLQGTMLDNSGKWPMKAMHTVVVLDLLGLLAAYATGGSRDWGTFGYVLAMAVTVLAYVAIYMVLSYGNNKEKGRKNGTASGCNCSCNTNSCPARSKQGHEEQINGSALPPVTGTGLNDHLSSPPPELED